MIYLYLTLASTTSLVTGYLFISSAEWPDLCVILSGTFVHHGTMTLWQQVCVRERGGGGEGCEWVCAHACICVHERKEERERGRERRGLKE